MMQIDSVFSVDMSTLCCISKVFFEAICIQNIYFTYQKVCVFNLIPEFVTGSSLWVISVNLTLLCLFSQLNVVSPNFVLYSLWQYSSYLTLCVFNLRSMLSLVLCLQALQGGLAFSAFHPWLGNGESDAVVNQRIKDIIHLPTINIIMTYPSSASWSVYNAQDMQRNCQWSQKRKWKVDEEWEFMWVERVEACGGMGGGRNEVSPIKRLKGTIGLSQLGLDAD